MPLFDFLCPKCLAAEEDVLLGNPSGFACPQCASQMDNVTPLPALPLVGLCHSKTVRPRGFQTSFDDNKKYRAMCEARGLREVHSGSREWKEHVESTREACEKQVQREGGYKDYAEFRKDTAHRRALRREAKEK